MMITNKLASFLTLGLVGVAMFGSPVMAAKEGGFRGGLVDPQDNGNDFAHRLAMVSGRRSVTEVLRGLFSTPAGTEDSSIMSAERRLASCVGDPLPASQVDLRGNSEYTPGQCPANDIVILGASLDTGSPCNTCMPGDTVVADLIISINHGTNSGGRYLGVFADLTETDPDGNAMPVTCDAARCSGPVLKDNEETGDQQVLNYGQVTFTCGNSLKLSDILLVWTAANGECPLTPANNPNGKYCFDNGVIAIDPPFNAVVTAACGTEANKVNYDLTVSGGKGPFTYSWFPGGATTEDLTNVASGTYTVTVTDNAACTTQATTPVFDTSICDRCIGKDCSDFDDQCNVGTCDPTDGSCYAAPTNQDGPCDDGDFCNVGETCDAGTCQGGAAKDCSSFTDTCNDGQCNTADGSCFAAPTNDGGACDDGDFCNVGETCLEGACQGGAAKDCNDMDDCTVDSCNEDTDMCVNTPVDTDSDGVLDCDEYPGCEFSEIPEGVPTNNLGMNRWALAQEGNYNFQTKNPPGGGDNFRSFTTEDTGGCTCEQIIAICGYGQGHTKFGCSNSVMDWWTGKYDREGSDRFECKDERIRG